MTVEPQDNSVVAVGVDEAARRLGIGRTKTFELLRTGALRSIKVGRRRIVPIEALLSFVDLDSDTYSAGLMGSAPTASPALPPESIERPPVPYGVGGGRRLIGQLPTHKSTAG